MGRLRRSVLLLALLLVPATHGALRPAQADAVARAINPSNTEIWFRGYMFGLVPVDGHFAGLAGSLRLDPADPEFCDIEVSVEVTSLVMAREIDRRWALGPDFLDAARFPELVFRGTCHAAGNGPSELIGTLSMHGLTLPLALAVTHQGNEFVAETSLHRERWGITGRPLLAGSTVRIRVVTRILGER